MKYKLIPIILSALLIAACGNKESTDNASPSLSDVTSSEAVKKAAESTMSKGDPSKPLSEYREIKSGNDLMFLYQGMLNLPVDYDKIAEVYSDDYRITQDAFKKQDIISALKDRINGQIDAAKNSRYIVWVNSSPYSSILQSYDMKNKSFTVKDWDPESYWYWNDNASRYHLTFSNVPQFQASYNASKAAVIHLAKSLAVEWAPAGIRVNALSPGYTLSDMTRQFMDANPDLRDQWVSTIPAGRMGDPEDLVGMTTFLASPASSYLTGQSLVIDGGYTAI